MAEVTHEMLERAWHAMRSSADDLRAAGGSVSVHNDYMQNGERRTFWQMTFPLGPETRRGKGLVALIGEGLTDEEALDKIRGQFAELTDNHKHAPRCPANHYHGMVAPSGKCTCGAVEHGIMMRSR